VRGVIAALITPYNEYGGIDTDGVGRLAERAIAGGVDALLVNAPIGEAPHLSRGERLFVIEAAREAAAGRVPLYAGTGAAGGEETLALTWDAANAGVDAAFVVAPAYYPLPQAALLAHYRAIARRGRLPIVPHNAPTRLGNELLPTTLATLAGEPGIAALAQDGRDPLALAATRGLVAGRAAVLSGDANTADPAAGPGIVSALAGILPRIIVAAPAAADANARWEGSHPLRALLADEGSAPSVAKAALTILGLPGGVPRAPMPGLDDTERAALVALLDALAGADAASPAAPPPMPPPR
jgi:4-hydroxy-tetrahydrodipicolinate synthase